MAASGRLAFSLPGPPPPGVKPLDMERLEREKARLGDAKRRLANNLRMNEEAKRVLQRGSQGLLLQCAEGLEHDASCDPSSASSRAPSHAGGSNAVSSSDRKAVSPGRAAPPGNAGRHPPRQRPAPPSSSCALRIDAPVFPETLDEPLAASSERERHRSGTPECDGVVAAAAGSQATGAGARDGPFSAMEASSIEPQRTACRADVVPVRPARKPGCAPTNVSRMSIPRKRQSQDNSPLQRTSLKDRQHLRTSTSGAARSSSQRGSRNPSPRQKCVRSRLAAAVPVSVEEEQRTRAISKSGIAQSASESELLSTRSEDGPPEDDEQQSHSLASLALDAQLTSLDALDATRVVTASPPSDIRAIETESSVEAVVAHVSVKDGASKAPSRTTQRSWSQRDQHRSKLSASVPSLTTMPEPAASPAPSPSAGSVTAPSSAASSRAISVRGKKPHDSHRASSPGRVPKPSAPSASSSRPASRRASKSSPNTSRPVSPQSSRPPSRCRGSPPQSAPRAAMVAVPAAPTVRRPDGRSSLGGTPIAKSPAGTPPQSVVLEGAVLQQSMAQSWTASDSAQAQRPATHGVQNMQRNFVQAVEQQWEILRSQWSGTSAVDAYDNVSATSGCASSAPSSTSSPVSSCLLPVGSVSAKLGCRENGEELEVPDPFDCRQELFFGASTATASTATPPTTSTPPTTGGHCPSGTSGAQSEAMAPRCLEAAVASEERLADEAPSVVAASPENRGFGTWASSSSPLLALAALAEGYRSEAMNPAAAEPQASRRLACSHSAQLGLAAAAHSQSTPALLGAGALGISTAAALSSVTPVAASAFAATSIAALPAEAPRALAVSSSSSTPVRPVQRVSSTASALPAAAATSVVVAQRRAASALPAAADAQQAAAQHATMVKAVAAYAPMASPQSPTPSATSFAHRPQMQPPPQPVWRQTSQRLPAAVVASPGLPPPE